MDSIILPLEILEYIASKVAEIGNLPTLCALRCTCKEGGSIIAHIPLLDIGVCTLSSLERMLSLFPSEKKPCISGIIEVYEEQPFPLFDFSKLTIVYRVATMEPMILTPLLSKASSDPDKEIHVYDMHSKLMVQGTRGFISEAIYCQCPTTGDIYPLTGPKIICSRAFPRPNSHITSLWLRKPNGRNVWNPLVCTVNTELKELIIDHPWLCPSGAFPNLERVEGPLYFPLSDIITGKVPPKLGVYGYSPSTVENVELALGAEKPLCLWVAKGLLKYYQAKFTGYPGIVDIKAIPYHNG